MPISINMKELMEVKSFIFCILYLQEKYFENYIFWWPRIEIQSVLSSEKKTKRERELL